MMSAKQISIHLKQTLANIEYKKRINEISLNLFLDALVNIINTQIKQSLLDSADLPTVVKIINIDAFKKATSFPMIIDITNDIVNIFSDNITKIKSYNLDLDLARARVGIEGRGFTFMGGSKEQKLLKKRQDYIHSLNNKIQQCKTLDDLNNFNILFKKMEVENATKKEEFNKLCRTIVGDLKTPSPSKKEIKSNPVSPLPIAQDIKPDHQGQANKSQVNAFLELELRKNIKDAETINALINLKDKCRPNQKYNALFNSNRSGFREEFYKKGHALYKADKSNGNIERNIANMNVTYDKIFLDEEDHSNLQNESARTYIADVFLLKLKLARPDVQSLEALETELKGYKKYFRASGLEVFYKKNQLNRDWETLLHQFEERAKILREEIGIELGADSPSINPF